MVNKGYKLKIEKASLVLRRVRLRQQLYESIIQNLQYTPAQYAFRRFHTFGPFQLTAGHSSFNEKVFTGIRPTLLLMVMIDATAVSGDFRKNPFYFQKFDLSYAQFSFESQHYPTPEAFEPEVNSFEEYIIPRAILNNNKVG